MSEFIDRTIGKLQERRDKVLNGGINSIPSPFERFRDDFLGIEQGKYYLITASTKASKTQFTSFMFLYNSLLFAYEHPDKLRLRIFYYALEETPEDILLRFMSHLIYMKTGLEVSPENLKSSRNDSPVSQEVLELLKQDEYQKMMRFFEDTVIFSTSTNPTGVWTECRSYADKHGKSIYKKVKIKDESGVEKEVDKFDYYVPDDPNEYRLIIYDHVSLISTERGMTLKQSIDKLSEYLVILRNRYGFSPVVVQQQAFAGESLDAFKENKLRPTIANTSDSKYCSRDCNVALGLFSPYKHEISNYKGYPIDIFKDNIRFLEVLVNRGGQMGGLIALYFNGAVCDFKALPRPDDKVAMEKWCQWIKSKREKKNVKSFFAIIRKMFNKIN